MGSVERDTIRVHRLYGRRHKAEGKRAFRAALRLGAKYMPKKQVAVSLPPKIHRMLYDYALMLGVSPAALLMRETDQFMRQLPALLDEAILMRSDGDLDET